MKITRIITSIILSVGLFSSVFAADAKPSTAKGKVKEYPLTTCIVTENDLESMGGAVRKVYDGQEVKFCCRPCIKKFEKNPEKYLPRLEKPAPAPAAEPKKS